jgi:hypothetical protein
MIANFEFYRCFDLIASIEIRLLCSFFMLIPCSDFIYRRGRWDKLMRRHRDCGAKVAASDFIFRCHPTEASGTFRECYYWVPERGGGRFS